MVNYIYIYIERERERVREREFREWNINNNNDNDNNNKKIWNMNVTIIPIVIGAFGIVTKGLLKGVKDLEVGGQIETTQTTALLTTARILRSVLET